MEDEIETGTCLECGYPLTPVRPGKHQCDYCELLECYEEQMDDNRELVKEIQQLRAALAMMTESNDALQAEIQRLLNNKVDSP